ncbi:MAG: sn-glycerol-1-phosphate dehydrogenase [Clostridia bacterium]
MNVLNLKLEDLSRLSFDCECGMHHSLNIDQIVYGRNILENVVKAAEKYAKGGPVLVVCDQNTYKAYAAEVQEAFLNAGMNSSLYIFRSKHDLLPDNRQIGKMVIEVSGDIALMVAVGSGVINDITRLVSRKMKIPYMVVCTAPSMDGYASATSSLIIDDIKDTIPGQLPKGIFADEEVLQKAPGRMIKAGFGDVIGKLTALTDWDLGVTLLQEVKCPVITDMVNQAVNRCIENAAGVRNNDKEAVARVFEALTIAGVTMGLNKNTRPASGAEHHLAHFWDLSAIRRNKEHALHGESVGVGAIVISRMYELAKDLIPQNIQGPSSEYVRNVLLSAGAKISPSELDVSKEDFKDSLVYGYKISPKYTVLTYLNERYPSLLKEFAEKITEECYSF